MRDIKFRAKAKTGKMVEGLLFHGNKIVTVTTNDNKSPYVEKGSTNYYYDYLDIDPKTVGQFTGLKDINGKEIFEGDIVLTQNETTTVIVYEFAAFHVNGEREGKKVSHPLANQCIMEKGSKIDFEVIGNIHEHPNLLK
jgi:uncharacterized phage protein (TIGR01671 family)